QGVKTLGFIGFDDVYGQGWQEVMKQAADARGIKLVAVERYQPTDPGVGAQIGRLLAAKPEGVLVAGSGTAVALPHRELKSRGYKGIIYQTHGAANQDMLNACGEHCNGMYMPAGPLLVARQLPDEHPVKKSALEYKTRYEAKYGP